MYPRVELPAFLSLGLEQFLFVFRMGPDPPHRDILPLP